MKDNHFLEIILILITVSLVFTIGLLQTRYDMKKQSLEGYKAFAIYETNTVGEVKIKAIEWKKN